MSVEEMRVAIAKVYSGKAWKERVRKMPDYQVTAIYFSFLENGRFDGKNKKPKPTEPQEEVRQFKPWIGVQLSLF